MRLLFFAQCADWVGCRELKVSIPKPVPASQLLETIPALRPLQERMSWLRIAVNQDFADWSSEVQDDDDVAFLPPVSGG